MERKDGVKISAQFNSKGIWSVLWALALLNIFVVLKYITFFKWEVCIMFCVIAFVLSAAGLFIGIRPFRAKLEIDEKNIFYKTTLGREKYLPVNRVTAVGKGFLNSVYIVSPSCKIKCRLVKNRAEIVDALVSMLEEK